MVDNGRLPISGELKMKLGSKYDLLDTPCILKYKQIYWSKYLQSVEWSKYLYFQPLPYNGIFSCRQIFAVLSEKHGDYFSRIFIFAVGNVREK